MEILSAIGLSKSFGGVHAVRNVSLSAKEREIIGIIGPNGAGKTTFFNLITGFLKPDAGRIFYLGKEITYEPPEERAKMGLVRTFQIVQPFGGLTVKENVLIGALNRHRSVKGAMEEAMRILRFVGLEKSSSRLANALTSMDLKRLELARALAADPKVLLLDEVMAGLNPTELREAMKLIRQIHDSGVTIIMVEHVMQAIMTLAERILVMSEGQLIAEGNPSEVASNSEVIAAYLGRRRVCSTKVR